MTVTDDGPYSEPYDCQWKEMINEKWKLKNAKVVYT